MICEWHMIFREGMSSEDYQRYSEQYVHIQQITKLYEEEPDNYTKLVDLLQQVHCAMARHTQSCSLITPSQCMPRDCSLKCVLNSGEFRSYAEAQHAVGCLCK